MRVIPLRQRLLLLLAILSSLTLVALGTFSYMRAKDIMLRGAESAMALQADTLANTIVSQYAGEYARAVAALRQDQRMLACLAGRPCDREGLLASWSSFLRLRSEAYFVYFADMSGRIMVMQPPRELPADFDGSVRPWFRRAMRNPGVVGWSDPYTEIVTGKTVVSTVATVDNPAGGKPLGVLGLDITTEGLHTILHGVALPKGSGLLVLTADGQPVTATGLGAMLADRLDTTPLRNLARGTYAAHAAPDNDHTIGGTLGDNAGNGATYLTIDGERVLAAVRAVPGPGWRLALLVPQEELLHAVAPIRYGTILAIGGMLTLFAVLFALATAGASGRVGQLAEYMRSVARGDFTVRNLFPGRDEFGELNRHLNELVMARRDAESALRDAERQHRELVENAPIGIFRTTWDGTILVLNQHGAALLGFRDTDHARALLDDSVIPLYAEPLDRQAMLDGLIAGEVVTGHRQRWFRRGGEAIWVSLYARRTGTPEAPEVESFFLDVTDQVEDTKRLEQLATTDELTGVSNRRHFMARLEDEATRSQRYARPLSVLLLDADHFKSVNDTWGHEAGDMVLRHITDVMGLSLRENDLIGRLGGEEFGVLLPETALDRALRTAERIRSAVEDAPVAVRDVWIGCTVSVGAAEYRGANDSLDDLMRRADHMLMRAKESGRNRVCAQQETPTCPGNIDGTGSGDTSGNGQDAA
ncbi:MAG TPA: diguanylate cyclase [Nitratidesulfovibrio sp.]|nr:diguanylate cyclase [Nitratidesulfovibrio sp.]